MGVGCLLGQSVRGVLRVRTVSKVPAHASRLVKKGLGRPNNFFTVAAIEECSNWDVGVGPFGSCNTAQTTKKQLSIKVHLVFHVLHHPSDRMACT